MSTSQADVFKATGNAAFSAGKHDEAIEAFSEAIELEPSSHVLYSNRSAAYASKGVYEAALQDALKTVELAPHWAKGYSRLGAAYHGLNKIPEATEAYDRGLAIDPENDILLRGRASLKQENVFESILKDPKIWERVTASPKLRDFAKDPSYCQKLTTLIQNPSMAMSMFNDQRIMSTLLTLMGIDVGGDASARDECDGPHQAAEPADPHAERIAKIAKIKNEGNIAYRARRFEDALAHYDEAFKLSDDLEPTLLTNKASVYFEMGNYEECIALCNKAIELGKAQRTGFEFVAKALARIGNALHKMGRLDEAIEAYRSSLTEKRTPQVLKIVQELEKEKMVAEKNAYQNPELALKAREEGNVLFAEQKYADAVKLYSESILRDGSDPRAYSNRAACYHKLGALPEALKDIDQCLELDPSFVKAYIRKASVLLLRKSYEEALTACKKASEIDTENKHSGELTDLSMRARQGIYELQQKLRDSKDPNAKEEAIKNAMRDPEVQKILQDPYMMNVLQQMQNNPKAAADLMKDKVIFDKVQKLAASGVLSFQ